MIVLGLLFAAQTRNGIYRDPVALWQDTIRKSPNGERPHYNLGTELKNVGRLDQARLEWERTVELNPRHSQALNQLGSIWFLKKDYEKAEYYYLSAVQADRDNVEACYNLAMTFELKGNREQALFYYERFLQKAPPEFHDLAMTVTRKIGVLRNAMPH
jgi:protein O-mannosyl-transferase